MLASPKILQTYCIFLHVNSDSINNSSRYLHCMLSLQCLNYIFHVLVYENMYTWMQFIYEKNEPLSMWPCLLPLRFYRLLDPRSWCISLTQSHEQHWHNRAVTIVSSGSQCQNQYRIWLALVQNGTWNMVITSTKNKSCMDGGDGGCGCHSSRFECTSYMLVFAMHTCVCNVVLNGFNHRMVLCAGSNHFPQWITDFVFIYVFIFMQCEHVYDAVKSEHIHNALCLVVQFWHYINENFHFYPFSRHLCIPAPTHWWPSFWSRNIWWESSPLIVF